MGECIEILPYSVRQGYVARLWRLLPGPHMLQCLSSSTSLLGATIQQGFDQIHRIVGHIAPISGVKLESTTLDCLHDIVFSSTIERRVATMQHIHYDPTRPHVARLGVISSKHFRAYIVGCTCFGRHRAMHTITCQTKIYQLDGALGNRCLRPEHAVLGFEVPMAIPFLMHVVYCPKYLQHDVGSFRLLESGCCGDSTEQIATTAKLHYEIDHLGIDDALVKLHNVGVVQLSHDLHFAL
mmetsp:Transcript_65356/g.156257  ORF Transcript_65356/g.156257 Transcript_65356/m.156257 type:complete len:239 (-) Transcript_65356:331-1047(-)